MTGYPVCRAEPARQRGYIMLPVALALALLAAITWMLNREGAIHADMAENTARAAEAEHVAHSGLAHAKWWTGNNGCAGDGTMATVNFGPGGMHDYTATVESPATTSTGYTLTPDRDTWIKEAAPANNFGADLQLSVKNKPGDSFRALYHFDLSAIPAGSRVVSATLGLHIVDNDDQGDVLVHRLVTDWTEANATWNSIGNQYEKHPYARLPAQPISAAWARLNLTALAQAWVNDPAANQGILLIATSSDLESKYTSRGHSSQQRPYLEVTTADGAVSPVQITATGTLYGGISRTVTHSDVIALQSAGGSPEFQPGSIGQDTYIDDGNPDTNLDGSDNLRLSNKTNSQKRGLLRFDLGAIPAGSTVTSAELEMSLLGIGSGGTASVDVHRVTTAWAENEVTWNESYSGSPWVGAGGDYDPAVEATAAIDAAVPGPTTWDLKRLVAGWVAGSLSNHGLMLIGSADVNHADFSSSDEATAALRPRLRVTYLGCECGSPCLTPQGSGTVLMVVINPTTLVPEDVYKKSLFESWGYTVTVVGESDNQATYDAAIAAADVVFISETVNFNGVGTKLVNAPIGVVSQDGAYNDDLGISNNAGVTVGSGINITDTSHYITELFPSGSLEIYDADMELLAIFNGPAPDLQTLADVTGNSSLVVLEAGATLRGGATAAGRRVMLPLGRDARFNWDYLSSSGKLIVHRALQWGMGNDAGVPNLLLVIPGSAPTVQEQLRIDLIESWGYSVNLIDDDATQANFDAAVAANDVVYVASTTNHSSVTGKLDNAGIGIAFENKKLTQDFGMTSDSNSGPVDTAITIVQNTHYITSAFAPGPLTIFDTSVETAVIQGTLAGDLGILGEVTGAQIALATLDAGATRVDAAPSPGRRVKLPWGPASFDPTVLSADGLTLMQRAIDWAEGAGGVTTPESVLLVVTDAGSPTQQELDRQALIEGWGYTVNLISASDSQANFDAAVAAADLAYVVEQQQSTALGTKLRDATITVVNEEAELRQDIGFAANRDWPSTRDTVDIVDNTHYITLPFATGLNTIASAPIEVVSLSGQLAGGLQVLGEQDWGGAQASLAIIDTGGDLYGGGTAAGRRVQLPWGRTGFDINDLNTSGLKIMQRAIEWGIAGGSPPAGPVFEEFTEASDNGATSLIISKPAGTAAGDLLIAAVATDDNTAASLAAPAGWNVTHVADQGGNVTFGVWWKLAAASEPGSHTFTWSGSEHVYGWIMRFTGHDPANPINTSSNDAGSGAAPSSPGVTTTVSDALILRLGGFDDDDIVTGDPGLSGHTAINMGDSGNGPATASGGSGYAVQATAGASGVSSFTLTGSEEYVTITLGIAPAP